MRQQKEKWNHTRTIAYMTYLSIPEKGKKKTIDQWWSLDAKKSIENWQKEALKQAQIDAVNEAKQKKLVNG